uniref:NADH dehydrogenase I subunit M n=1 Tax=uncultured Chloroflexota bacterium TaxID=166587 RepID=H5SA73_9CHLR|nr:NADH dehydrogenase I subunit M [uncultured Chloroflexota bacterium]
MEAWNMDFLNTHLLSLILFFPTLAALGMLFLPKERVGLLRWYAFLASLVPLALSIYLWVKFDPNLPGFQFEERYVWYEAIHSTLHLGVDGLSLTMVLLTTLLTPLAILASFSITDRVKAYMMLFLFLETGMLGVFLALDLLIFFVFWEVGLVPMYFLINQWGSANRDYASMKFMIYTMGGSLGLLLSIQLLGVLFQTYDLVELTQRWSALTEGSLLGMSVSTVKAIAFWAFVIAFAIKVPVWPFHTWLPDAHTEAPTAGSMILAGVLLKLGAYGFLRLVLPFYPQEARMYAGALAFLATAAIIFGAFASYAQSDFKRLVAYSSVNHMGFVVLGIAAAALAAGTTDARIALNGAILQMFNHGLSAAGMFFLVGVIYERTHTRNLNDFGGLFPLVPIYGGILIFTSMASLGLPGLNGFVSEFLVVRGAYPILTVYTAISMLGLLFTGAYILKGIRQVLHGPLNERWAHGEHRLSEINTREIVVMAPLMALMLLIGLWPSWILEVINRAVMMLF